MARRRLLESPTERSRADEHLGPADYRAMYDHSPDGVLFSSPDGRVIAANPAACRMLGRTEEEICRLGRQGMWDRGDGRWDGLLDERAKAGHASGIARMVRGDGAKIEIEMSAVVFTDLTGQARSCTILRDVTERVQLERDLVEASEALRALALTDELTGLHNRRGFIAIGRQVLEIAARERRSVAAMFVDIDDMKAVNDRHGHDAGDEALRTVAAALRDELRSADTIARIGGDEFVGLVLGLGDADLRSVEQRIRQRLRAGQAQVMDRVGVSIGWSVQRPDSALTIERLLADADRAMYRVKATRDGWRRDTRGG